MCICCHKVQEFCRCDNPERLLNQGFKEALQAVREVMQNQTLANGENTLEYEFGFDRHSTILLSKLDELEQKMTI